MDTVRKFLWNEASTTKCKWESTQGYQCKLLVFLLTVYYPCIFNLLSNLTYSYHNSSINDKGQTSKCVLILSNPFKAHRTVDNSWWFYSRLSGKTATIVSLVQLLVKLGQSVLVTSHTHSAVDNVLLKLAARNVDLLRLGSSSRFHPDLHDKGEGSLTSNCVSPTQLEALYNSKVGD
jgi:hypothetical protein